MERVITRHISDIVTNHRQPPHPSASGAASSGALRTNHSLVAQTCGCVPMFSPGSATSWFRTSDATLTWEIGGGWLGRNTKARTCGPARGTPQASAARLGLEIVPSSRVRDRVKRSSSVPWPCTAISGAVLLVAIRRPRRGGSEGRQPMLLVAPRGSHAPSRHTNPSPDRRSR
jgi:hypothetical protein